MGVELLNINQRGLCFSLVIADTESTGAGAAVAMQTLVDAGVVGVIVPHSTEEALWALPIAETNQIPMITFGAFSDEAMEDAWEDCGLTCTPQDYGYLWRVSPGEAHHVSALSALISSDGHSNVAILHDDGRIMRLQPVLRRSWEPPALRNPLLRHKQTTVPRFQPCQL